MAFPRPFEGRYGVSLTIAILALAPYIVVTTAYPLYRGPVGHAVGAGRTALEIISGIATAGYAFGALLGGDLINRFRQRWLFFPAEGMFIVGRLLAAGASGTVVYGAGRVLQGFATGLLLVIALPPVIQRFPPGRMPITAAFVNIGFFGAVTLGPLLGGGVILLTLGTRGSPAAMRAAIGLFGLGAGATVSPGLYLAAFSLPSKMVGRIFALVELVRSVADFLLAPVMLEVARVASGGKALTPEGIREALWITLLLTIGSTVLGIVLYLLGNVGLPRPDLDAWLKEGRTALASPLLAQALRHRDSQPQPSMRS